MKRLGRYTLLFERRPAILGHAAVCGKKEAAGPLARDFDVSRFLFESGKLGKSGKHAANGSREPCDTQGGTSKAGH